MRILPSKGLPDMHTDALPLSELRTLIARHAGPPNATQLLPGVVVAVSALPTLPLAHIAEPVLAVVAQGAKRAVLGDGVFDYGAGQFLIVSVDLPLNAHITRASPSEPFLGFGLMLKPEAIAALLLETGTPRRLGAEPRGIAVNNLTNDLLDPIVRLLRLFDRPEDVPVLAPAVEREILWRLVNGAQGAMVRQLGLADSRMAQSDARSAGSAITTPNPCRIETLADLAGMSVTSFHRHFLGVTSMTPLQFQKQIRLQEARAQLLAAPDDVAAVGFSVGYDSPSQFSREYRRLFGAPPGRDARRLRQGAIA